MDFDGSDVLIVAATAAEVSPLLQRIGVKENEVEVGNVVHVRDGVASLLITGPGVAATTYHLTRVLTKGKYRMALNVGIAGAYSQKLNIGDVVMVTKDRFADLGAEAPEGFMTGEHLPFSGLGHHPYQQGWLSPEIPSGLPPIKLPKSTAITSDTVHTLKESIASLTTLYNPDLETMEGAAFFYVCMMTATPCLQVRSVSNHVGPRTRSTWNIGLAIKTLNQYLIDSPFNL